MTEQKYLMTVHQKPGPLTRQQIKMMYVLHVGFWWLDNHCSIGVTWTTLGVFESACSTARVGFASSPPKTRILAST